MDTVMLRHGSLVLASFVTWQGITNALHKRGLPHELFTLTHHCVLSSASWYYVARACSHVLHNPGPEGISSAATLYAAPGDYPSTIGYIFIGYLIADGVNHKLPSRPFGFWDWVHHALGITFATTGLVSVPSTFIEAALVGVQETSSIFLTLSSMGVKRAKLMFVLTFIIMRIGLGGALAFLRYRQYKEGAYPSASLVGFWFAQLAMNSVFTALIVRKAWKSRARTPAAA